MMSSVRNFLRGFVYAVHGVGVAARGRNFRVMLGGGVGAVVAGIVRDLDAGEWAVIAICIGTVLALEAMNTALESLADAVHPDRHPAIGRAKDAAAGASLVASLMAAVAGVLVYL